MTSLNKLHDVVLKTFKLRANLSNVIDEQIMVAVVK